MQENLEERLLEEDSSTLQESDIEEDELAAIDRALLNLGSSEGPGSSNRCFHGVVFATLTLTILGALFFLAFQMDASTRTSICGYSIHMLLTGGRNSSRTRCPGRGGGSWRGRQRVPFPSTNYLPTVMLTT